MTVAGAALSYSGLVAILLLALYKRSIKFNFIHISDTYLSTSSRTGVKGEYSGGVGLLSSSSSLIKVIYSLHVAKK